MQKEYGGKTLSDFLEKHKPVFEEYLKKLESNRKTFVWRSGALEDAILSSENRTIILELLVPTEQETTEDTSPHSQPPKHGKNDELKDTGKGSQKLKKKKDNSCNKTNEKTPEYVLKLKLKERLDEYTRKQFSKNLKNVLEVKNFLEFIAREDTKPDKMQYSDSHESDNSPSGITGSWWSSISRKTYYLLFGLSLFSCFCFGCLVSNGRLPCYSPFSFSYYDYIFSFFF